MRAIDADAISYESIDSCDTGRHEHYYGTGIIAVRKEDIDTMPTIQPAEPKIIRCKDCKHWIPYDWMFSEIWQSKNIADYPEDEIGCAWSDMAMKADDFCSRAERREVTT